VQEAKESRVAALLAELSEGKRELSEGKREQAELERQLATMKSSETTLTVQVRTVQ